MIPQQLPTETLIAELVGRPDFRGFIAWQPGYAGEPTTDFRWRSERCDAESVCREIAAHLVEARLKAQVEARVEAPTVPIAEAATDFEAAYEDSE